MEKQTITISMKKIKETKNTFRFEEQAIGKPPIIGTLYIQKWAIDSSVDTLTVTIEIEE